MSTRSRLTGEVEATSIDSLVFMAKNGVVFVALAVVIGMVLYVLVGAPAIPQNVWQVLLLGALLLTLFNTVVCALTFLIVLRLAAKLSELELSGAMDFMGEVAVWIPAVRSVLGRKWEVATHSMTDKERAVMLKMIMEELRKK